MGESTQKKMRFGAEPTVENLCRAYCANLSEEGFLHVMERLHHHDWQEAVRCAIQIKSFTQSPSCLVLSCLVLSFARCAFRCAMPLPSSCVCWALKLTGSVHSFAACVRAV